MADPNSNAPVLKKPLPPFVAHEKGSFGPIHLSDFVDTTDTGQGNVRFSAVLQNGSGLPAGLICTTNGVFGGIPALGTVGTYDIYFIAENDSADTLKIPATITINPVIAMEDPSFFGEFKSKVWEALGSNLPLPELQDVLSRPISAVEIYYLMERYGVLIVWDVYNLESPSKPVLLKLLGMNPHYDIYDRGSCLVAAPKKLFSHARTLQDALDASRMLAREVYKRGWTIEFGGFNKMVSAAWVELQLMADKNNGRRLEILHYEPNTNEMALYKKALEASNLRPSI